MLLHIIFVLCGLKSNFKLIRICNSKFVWRIRKEKKEEILSLSHSRLAGPVGPPFLPRPSRPARPFLLPRSASRPSCGLASRAAHAPPILSVADRWARLVGVTFFLRLVSEQDTADTADSAFATPRLGVLPTLLCPHK